MVATANAGGVMVVSDHHEALVGGHVTDPEGGRLGELRIGRVVRVHPFRAALGLIILAPLDFWPT